MGVNLLTRMATDFWMMRSTQFPNDSRIGGKRTGRSSTLGSQVCNSLIYRHLSARDRAGFAIGMMRQHCLGCIGHVALLWL